jgi:hypothetical protein
MEAVRSNLRRLNWPAVAWLCLVAFGLMQVL